MGKQEENILLPLMNSAFHPGDCYKTLQEIGSPVERDFGKAEYYYFTGHPEETVIIMQPYLKSEDIYQRLTACFLYAYASLSVDNLQNCYDILVEMTNDFNEAKKCKDIPEPLNSFGTLVCGAAATLLYLPGGGTGCEGLDLNVFPQGLRSFACYVAAHNNYINGDYAGSLGVVRTALAFQPETYVIPTIYLHVIATMDYIGLKEPEKAREQMGRAMELAGPDGLLEAFGEHHSHLGGLVEACFKKEHPEEFKRIIEITCNFANGWRKMHSMFAGDELVDNLTSTEFAVGTLAGRGWSNQEIAEQMDISINTVKYHISSIINKLEIESRAQLKDLLYW